MYPRNEDNKPMSNWDDDQYSGEPGESETKVERNPSTGAMERVTNYSDGSSKRHGGGPAGDMNYDEFGEEC
jgi:hypothetical protein